MSGLLFSTGHIPGTSEVNPKLQLPVENLVTYLRENLKLYQEEPPVIRQFKHGQSNPTYYISYGGAELVLRKKPVCFCCRFDTTHTTHTHAAHVCRHTHTHC